MILKRKGFTLIELLIVVAIIAILAAIAVPNFLEAQVRSKISRGKADMRAMATAMEAYKIDTNKYPPDFQWYQMGGGDPNDKFANCCLGRLTTPVAYMTSLPSNVFKYKPGQAHDGDAQWYGYKGETSWRDIVFPGIVSSGGNFTSTNLWVLMSVGPDQVASAGEYAMFGERYVCEMPPTDQSNSITPGSNGPAIYDPTNGTVSPGDIVRVGP